MSKIKEGYYVLSLTFLQGSARFQTKNATFSPEIFLYLFLE